MLFISITFQFQLLSKVLPNKSKVHVENLLTGNENRYCQLNVKILKFVMAGGKQ